MEKVTKQRRAKAKISCVTKRGQNGSNAGTRQLNVSDGENLFLSPCDDGVGSIWEGTLGKSNRGFIAAGLCTTCNKYCQHASRTSNNAILLLMTETERTNIDIIHPCTICCQLQLQKSNEIETAKYCKNYWHGKKVAFIKMRK